MGITQEPLAIDRSTETVSAQVPMGTTAQRSDGGPLTRFVEYGVTIDKVTNMVNNDSVINRASMRGLDVLDVTWEDTGREMGSSIGPNISDLTLQVRRKSPWVEGAYVTRQVTGKTDTIDIARRLGELVIASRCEVAMAAEDAKPART